MKAKVVKYLKQISCFNLFTRYINYKLKQISSKRSACKYAP